MAEPINPRGAAMRALEYEKFCVSVIDDMLAFKGDQRLSEQLDALRYHLFITANSLHRYAGSCMGDAGNDDPR